MNRTKNCDQSLNVLPLEVLLWRGKRWDHINWFNPTTISVCPKTGPGFLTSFVMVFRCWMICGEKCLFVLLKFVEWLTILHILQHCTNKHIFSIKFGIKSELFVIKWKAKIPTCDNSFVQKSWSSSDM